MPLQKKFGRRIERSPPPPPPITVLHARAHRRPYCSSYCMYPVRSQFGLCSPAERIRPSSPHFSTYSEKVGWLVGVRSQTM